MGFLVDLGIILLYFAGISAIGLYMGRREESLKDFALAGRQVPWWAVMASIIAAETSAATFLGAPGEGFAKRSLAYVQLTMGVVLGRWVVANVFLKPYYDYKVYTVYDYLAVRFGPRSKSIVSALFLIMRTLASGSRLFIPSLVMVLAWKLFVEQQGKSITFQPVTTVGPYLVAIGALVLITAFYTTKGGIKAVIWTDVVQACIMFGSAIAAIVFLLNQIGGWSALTAAVPAMTRLDGYFVTGFETTGNLGFIGVIKHIFTGDYTIFSAVFGATMLNMAMFGTDQDMVQRMLTAETHQKAKRSLLSAAFLDIPIAAIFTFIGILLFVYYQQDPRFMPKSNADIFSSYILNVLPVGLRGLVLAGVFATAMGSLSAALNALATSATNDWYVPFLVRSGKYSDHTAMVAARWFTAIFSLLMFIVAGIFAYMKVADPSIRIIPVVLGIASYIVGPMLGVFLIGMLTKNRGSDTGNAIAVCVGLCTTGVLGYFQLVSFTWFALIGALVVVAIGIWFRTPDAAIALALRARESGIDEGDVPMFLREHRG
ncbi:MAG: sodium:solute symporter family transporter [Armatimonadota bacterium]